MALLATPDTTAVLAARSEIVAACERHGCGNVRIFGSVARGEAGPDSDLDLLVDIVGDTPQWFPGGLIAELEQLLGRHVDITTPEGLNPWLKERVMAEVLSLA